jgi:LacI family transcriptional regulator
VKKKVTIKDVAKEAGVSIATISYVINKKENLSPETIERVNNAIKKLNYVPDFSARSLVNNRSNLLGVVIPQNEPGKHLMFNNPFYSEFLSGVEYTARKMGYHVIITGENLDESYLDISKQRNLEGVIILGIYPEAFYNDLKKTNIPVVLVDSYCSDHYFHSIQINDRYGGYIATRHLIENGHRNIGLVTGQIRKEGVSEKRYLGYCDALKEFGIAFKPEFVFEGVVDYDYGIIAAEKITKSKGVTAVFATADILAISLMKRLKQLGVDVPGDISIIGFDDLYIDKLFEPGLTTVKQNIYGKGEAAVKMVIDCIHGAQKGKQDLILPIEIVERDSVRSVQV